MARLASSRGVRAGAFVAAAVALTLGVQALVHRPAAGRRLTGPGAAPPAVQPATQAEVFGSASDAGAVADAATGATGSELVPLPAAAFARPIARYRVYARHESAILAGRVRALTGALRSGDRPRAEAAWRRADSALERLGAAYGALGGLGDRIDGGAGGLPGGVRDPRWRGLRRIEYGLWTAHAAPRDLAGVSRTLQGDVARLRRVLGRSPITPLVYATRAHEILEDVQRDQLAGTPSGDGVRAAADGLAATNVVLGTLAPLLRGRGDAQAQSRFWLRRLGATLAAIRRRHGGYPAAARLSSGERERLDGTLGATLEALRGIPGELETPA